MLTVPKLPDISQEEIRWIRENEKKYPRLNKILNIKRLIPYNENIISELNELEKEKPDYKIIQITKMIMCPKGGEIL